MPNYDEVASLTIGRMMSDEDAASVVDPDTTLSEAADRLRKASSNSVVIMDRGRVVGVLSASDIADAVRRGNGPDTPAKIALEGKPMPVTVPESTSLEKVPDLVGPYSKVIVTDASGRPSGVIDRATLADRVRKLAL